MLNCHRVSLLKYAFPRLAWERRKGWMMPFHDGFNRFVNLTGYTHDFFNSWHYNWDTGFFQPFTNQLSAELFEIYSFIGMPIAGAYTAVSYSSNEILITNNLHKRFE